MAPKREAADAVEAAWRRLRAHTPLPGLMVIDRTLAGHDYRFYPRKVTPATIEFVDPPVTGQQGMRFVESLVALMRDADALAHVVRAFHHPAVPHPQGSVDAIRDFYALNNELLLADLGVVEKRLERLSKDIKKVRNPELDSEYALLQRCREALEPQIYLLFARSSTIEAEPVGPFLFSSGVDR